MYAWYFMGSVNQLALMSDQTQCCVWVGVSVWVWVLMLQSCRIGVTDSRKIETSQLNLLGIWVCMDNDAACLEDGVSHTPGPESAHETSQLG